MGFLSDPEIEQRVHQIDLKFSAFGLDKYGISRTWLTRFHQALAFFYRHYFRVEVVGIEHVPQIGRGLLIGNHSGGLPIDGAMVIESIFLEHSPPRHVHAAVEYFAQRFPFLAQFFNRIGQFTGLPEHIERMLREDRLALVFPEGARGSGKLYKDRYELVRFGTGFMRIALATETPIVPFAFVGGEEALPLVAHLKPIAKMLGVPYIPVPVQLLPLPLPVRCRIHYGEPMRFEGDGTEDDAVIEAYVNEVRDAIRRLIAQGLEDRRW